VEARSAAISRSGGRNFPGRSAGGVIAGRPIREFEQERELRAFLAAPRATPLLTTAKVWLSLEPAAHPSWRPLVSAAIAGRAIVLVGSQP